MNSTHRPARSQLIALIGIPLLAGAAFAQQKGYTATSQIPSFYVEQASVLMRDGRVLILGPDDCFGPCTGRQRSHIFNPTTGIWSSGGNMQSARVGFGTATALPNGKILAAGGLLTFDPSDALSAAELYDPVARTWTSTGSLAVARGLHQTVVLPGGKALVMGGLTDGGNSVASAEIYDPKTGLWTRTGSMRTARFYHTATVLQDGRVLVASGSGGRWSDEEFALLRTAEIFDPATGVWTDTGQLNTGRILHTATLLPDGRVLVVGGGTCFCDGFGTAEIWDPATGQWTATGNLTVSRNAHTATLLPNGQVLAAGGYNEDINHRNGEVYDPATGTWTATPNLNSVRSYHAATLMPNGRVLLSGGVDYDADDPLATAEFFGTLKTPAGTVATVSSASFFDNAAVAPNSYVASFGDGLATETAVDSLLPMTLGGVIVMVRDSAGVDRQARLYVVSPGQLNYLIPEGSASGKARVRVLRGGAEVAAGDVTIAPVAPAIFTADNSGHGLPAAIARTFGPGDAFSYHTVATFNAQGAAVAQPIHLGGAGEQVFLTLFGGGIRGAGSIDKVRATIAGLPAAVHFADASPEFPGLDQVDIFLDPSLAGSGEVEVVLTVNGFVANTVLIVLQ